MVRQFFLIGDEEDPQFILATHGDIPPPETFCEKLAVDISLLPTDELTLWQYILEGLCSVLGNFSPIIGLEDDSDCNYCGQITEDISKMPTDELTLLQGILKALCEMSVSLSPETACVCCTQITEDISKMPTDELTLLQGILKALCDLVNL